MLLTEEIRTAIVNWLNGAIQQLKEDNYSNESICSALNYFITHPDNWSDIIKEKPKSLDQKRRNLTIVEVISKTEISLYYEEPGFLFAQIDKNDIEQLNAVK